MTKRTQQPGLPGIDRAATRIEAYTHRATADPAAPDERPGNYYVSVRDSSRWSLLYGPFGRHAAALAAVEMVQRVALKVDPWSDFYDFGTARTADEWQPAPVGVLNHLLPPIAADNPEDDREPVNG